MQKKRIVILGAGISGLSLAWRLRALSSTHEIILLEKSERAGGWMHTDKETGYHFEKGPRSFKVDKSPATVQLIQELGMGNEVIWSEEKPHHRYLFLKGRLHKFPRSFFSFLFSPLTKGCFPALLTEWAKPALKEDETVWDFIARRLNEDVARLIFDPMVIGIFGGNSRYISTKSCFPVLKLWEEKYGSITKGFIAKMKEKKGKPSYSAEIPHLPLTAMYTFRNGMKGLVDQLVQKGPGTIHYNTSVDVLEKNGAKWTIHAGDQTIEADQIFCALPAAETARLFRPFVADLSAQIDQIESLSVVVVNAGYQKKVLPVEGFGYLTSTFSKEDVLGVVFDSSVFPEHNSQSLETRLTIKLDDTGLSEEEYIEKALKGIAKHLKISERPDVVSLKRATHAIPQYGLGHLDKMDALQKSFNARLPNCRLLGNYLVGVSVNQCIAHSKQVFEEYALDLN